jgi:hypothetical protein
LAYPIEYSRAPRISRTAPKPTSRPSHDPAPVSARADATDVSVAALVKSAVQVDGPSTTTTPGSTELVSTALPVPVVVPAAEPVPLVVVPVVVSVDVPSDVAEDERELELELDVVVVVVVGAVAQIGVVTALLARVTVPLRASARPCTFAPVATEIDEFPRIVPRKREPAPSAVVVPTCQKTLQGLAPPASSTVLAGAVTSVDNVLKMNTAFESPPALRVTVPVSAKDPVDESYTPGVSVVLPSSAATAAVAVRALASSKAAPRAVCACPAVTSPM